MLAAADDKGEVGDLMRKAGASKGALDRIVLAAAHEFKALGVTANVIHPGDVKTAMWADIRERVAGLGAVAENYVAWADWVAQTGGDPPEKAVALFEKIPNRTGANVAANRQ
mgnify:CR=1 FL=1